MTGDHKGIALAADGWEVDWSLSLSLALYYDRLAQIEASRAIFFRPSGAPLRTATGFEAGDRFVQRDLADSLEGKVEILHVIGDPVTLLLPQNAGKEEYARYYKLLGLDQPVYVQYWKFASRAVQGDFGKSWYTDTPAFKLVMERMPPTLYLSFAGLGMALLISLPLGILAALIGVGASAQRARNQSAPASSVSSSICG